MLQRGILFALVTGGLLAATAGSCRVAAPATVAGPVSGWTAPGYHALQVADQLSTPIAVAIGDRDEVFVAEAGTAPGTQPRVLSFRGGKARRTVAADFPAPLTGLVWRQGKLYVAYQGGIDLLDPVTGVHHPLLSRLPAAGDYPNGALAIGPDGALYMGIGAATNAGVVGLDNLERGWLRQHPSVHDIPCRDITVRGTNYSVANPLTADSQDMAATGPFSAFGTTTARLQAMPGAVPCTGAVLRTQLDGSGLELVAWGLRYPAGLAFGPDQQLYATVQGFEDRGSRPVVGDRDYFYRIEQDGWYGWPDFAGGVPVTAPQFQKASMPVSPLLAAPPGVPPAPIASFPSGSGAAGLIFPSDRFGLRGEALVALRGKAGGTLVRVNPRTGQATAFASRREPGALPTALTTAPDGSIYLADQGMLQPGQTGATPRPGSGSVWRFVPARPAQGARPEEVHWQWALVGVVLSLAGVQLIRRPA